MNALQINAKISIIVPVRRMAGKLANFYSWTTLLNGNYELIVVHDIDDLETAKELVDHLERRVTCKYLYVEKHYGSPGAARNAGLKLATCEWVMFWDSDDIGVVASIDSWLSQVDVEKTDLEVFRFTKCNVLNGGELEHSSWGQDFDENFFNWLIEPGIWRCIFRRTTVSDLVFPEILMGEDQVFILDVLGKGIIPTFSRLNVYKYYLGVPGQLTNSKEAIESITQATQIILERRDIEKDIVIKAVGILWTKMSLSGLKKLRFYHKVQIGLRLFLFGLLYTQVRATMYEVFKRRTKT